MNELQKPAGSSAPAANEPEIHVIPEQFYGAALKKKVVKEKPPAPSAPVTPIAPPPQVPPPTPPNMPPKPPMPPKKKGGHGVLIAILVLVLLTAGVAAAYYFMVLSKPANTNRPVNGNQNVNTTPAAVCGNARCEAPTESAANCATDCVSPAPVCGDNRCEAPLETESTCAADCGPVAPMCGNAACEAGEDATSCPADCQPPAPVVGPDADADGMSDEEERTVFGTNPNSPNSDSDSFVDLNEALNLFDPARPAPAMLADNPGFAWLSVPGGDAQMLRPASWTVTDRSANGESDVIITAPTGEFISVVSVAMTEPQPLLDWYLAQAPGVTSSQVEISKTRAGDDVVTSPDRQTSYVRRGNAVLVISYNLGPRTEVQYRVTFQAMVRSVTDNVIAVGP